MANFFRGQTSQDTVEGRERYRNAILKMAGKGATINEEPKLLVDHGDGVHIDSESTCHVSFQATFKLIFVRLLTAARLERQSLSSTLVMHVTTQDFFRETGLHSNG
jgi:ammonia channel protein AmtB